MINARLMVLGATIFLTMSACSQGEDVTEVAVVDTGNTLFAYVPASSPYVLGNLEPPTDEVIDTYLRRIQPVLDTMQEELSQGKQAIEAKQNEGSSSSPGQQHDDASIKLMHAVLVELDGKLNRPGLESLGFDLRSHKVVYGMGAFPVVRLGLSDAGALRGTIQRILDNAGISAPEKTYQSVSYWRLGEEGDDQEPVGLYVAILENHLALSLFPPMAESELLPAFLGLKLPEDSDAAARLAGLNTKYGYTAFGSGIMDLDKLMEEFITPDTILARSMAASGEFDPATMTPECKSEFRSLVSNTPRLTMGVTEWSVDAIGVQYRVETKPDLVQQLAGMVSEIPGVNHLSDRIFEFSFGMRFGAVRDFLREKAAAIMEAPYQCEHLAHLNESATQAFAQLNQPMPPFVNNFKGVRLSLSEVTMTDSIPENTRGQIAVHVEQPEMFVGMAQMFLPDLSNLTLVPGEPPVQLPASIIPMPGIVAFAALSDEAIGLSIGAGEETGLPDFLKQEPGPEGTFLSTNYDMAAYLDYTQDLGEQFEDMANEGEDTESEQVEQNVHYRSAQHISQSAQEAFKAFADRSQAELRFTKEGFVADSKMTFK